MKIVLDTGCIDFFLHDLKYDIFKKKIVQHEMQGDVITTTIINYAERKAGLNKWIEETKFPKKEVENQAQKERDRKIRKYRQILDFFDIIENDILYISKETAEIFANLRFKLKNDNSNNVSKGELKNMYNDIWIASLCIEYSCKLYTSNEKDFKKIKKVDSSLIFEHIQEQK